MQEANIRTDLLQDKEVLDELYKGFWVGFEAMRLEFLPGFGEVS